MHVSTFTGNILCCLYMYSSKREQNWSCSDCVYNYGTELRAVRSTWYNGKVCGHQTKDYKFSLWQVFFPFSPRSLYFTFKTAGKLSWNRKESFKKNVVTKEILQFNKAGTGILISSPITTSSYHNCYRGWVFVKYYLHWKCCCSI